MSEYRPSRLDLIALTVIVFATATIIAYKILFHALTSIIVYHLFLTCISVAILISLGLLLVHLKVKTKYLYSFIWSVFILCMILVYALAFIGQKIVGTPITLIMFYSYLKNVNQLILVTNTNPIVVYMLIFSFLVILIGGFLGQSTAIWKGLTSLYVFIERTTVQKTRKAVLIKRTFIIGFLVFTVALTYELHLDGLSNRLHVSHEPIFAVIIPNKISGISFNKHVEPISVRKNYPKNIAFEKKNVVLIIIDAQRADYLNVYGYRDKTSPFLSSLHQTGDLRKVNYVFSTSAMSFGGILSTLRSKLWTNLAPYNFGIQDLLKDQGYQVNFLLSGDHTKFFLLKETFGTSIDFYFDGSNTEKYYMNDDRLIFEGLDKLSPVLKTPVFFYFHLMSSHNLGNRLKENQLYKPAYVGRNVNAYRNNYKNGILQTDQNIKKLFKWLSEKGILQNSLVVITADHGESVGEDHLFSHAHNLRNREIMIPLLIYDTDHSKNYNSDHAIQADIAPTIIDRLGLPIPSSWEGESLLGPHNKPYSFHCFENDYAIIHYKDKLILKYCYNKKTNVEQVFEVTSDVKEKKDLLHLIDKVELASLRKMMRSYVKDTE